MTDSTRWRRLVFDFPQFVSIQDMDEDAGHYNRAKIDMNAKTIAATSVTDKNWNASFSFAQPQENQLILDGVMNGHKVRAQLQLFDRNKFLLVTRGFHWVSERPFNR
jgi:hypothetical protein